MDMRFCTWKVRFIQSPQDPRLFIISGDSSNLGAHPEDWGLDNGHMVLGNLDNTLSIKERKQLELFIDWLNFS